jgi:phage terminase small subunit
MMCAAWGDHVAARKAMAEAAKQVGTGMFVKSPNDYPMQSPWMAVSNKSIELYCRLALEFGMSPSARARVSAAPVMPPAGTASKESGWKQFG